MWHEHFSNLLNVQNERNTSTTRQGIKLTEERGQGEDSVELSVCSNIKTKDIKK